MCIVLYCIVCCVECGDVMWQWLWWWLTTTAYDLHVHTHRHWRTYWRTVSGTFNRMFGCMWYTTLTDHSIEVAAFNIPYTCVMYTFLTKGWQTTVDNALKSLLYSSTDNVFSFGEKLTLILFPFISKFKKNIQEIYQIRYFWL
jgi:hypothetical protein